MTLIKRDLELLKNISIEAAKEAGKIILKYKNRDFKIFKKDAGSSAASMVLTEVDLLAQNIILKKLKPVIERYDLGLLTEEEDDNRSRLEKEFFFSVDPMDGTKSFIDANEGFSVSVSLVSKDGFAVIGVVFDPVNNNCYSAIKGCGLYKNGLAWLPVFNNSSTDLKILVDASFNQLSLENITYSEYGGAVLNAIQVLEGRVDCYIKKPKKSIGGGSIWDFSATVALFNECSAVAEDCFSRPIMLNDPETSYMNRYGVIFCSDHVIKERILNLIKV